MTTKLKDIAELSQKLQGYSKNVSEQVAEMIEEEATELAKIIKQDAPIRKSGTSKTTKGATLSPGTYARGWTKKLDSKNADSVTWRVYNNGRQKPLVHLLEFGHNLQQGGTVKPIEHVLRNRNKIEDEIVARVEDILQNADIK